MRRVVVDRALAHELRRLSRAQNGAISGDQMRVAGLTRSAIRARVARGAIVAIFRDVYALGDPALLPFVTESAALLSLGPAALISHRSAVAVWGLSEGLPDIVDVTVVASNPRLRAGVRLHRVVSLHPADRAERANLRLTAPARTLIDYATDASSSEITYAFGEARAHGLITDQAIEAAIERTPSNHPGAAIVTALLSEGGTYDRSKAEALMRKHLRHAGLPQPRANHPVAGHLADFEWPELRLIVEVDGYRTHGNRTAFENDRRRDQVHVAAGYVVIRITWWQLQHEPMAVIARLAQAMAHRQAA